MQVSRLVSRVISIPGYDNLTPGTGIRQKFLSPAPLVQPHDPKTRLNQNVSASNCKIVGDQPLMHNQVG